MTSSDSPLVSNHFKRFAHRSGVTRLVYTKDGKYLFTVGNDAMIRKFTVKSEAEPTTIIIEDAMAEMDTEEDEDEIPDRIFGLATSVSILITLITDKHEKVMILTSNFYGCV